MHRVEIARRDDPRGRLVRAEFRAFGLERVTAVAVRDVYYLDEQLTRDQVDTIGRRLLCDPVVETYSTGPGQGFEILYNHGVSDPREESVRKAVADLGIALGRVRTGTNYRIETTHDPAEIKECARRFLYNPLIQHIRLAQEPEFSPRPYDFALRHVDLGSDLVRLSADLGLSLSRTEMETIRSHFQHLGRAPTDVELETIAQTWSEHCRHKTFLGTIECGDETIQNLLGSTIMKATCEISHPLCLSVFHDNSGVIEFDDEHGVCFKVETHNHPSALEPYGGAATGIGGVIRDILGTGLGARPIMNTDVFCFGLPEMPMASLPDGILHPQRIIKGVIQGVRDYGNRMGIPTASGAVYFDEEFTYNPLVFCGTVGIIRKDRVAKAVRPGDAVVLVGGRTGRDGIHGATFSSAELSVESEKSCVQIGNPIMEKRVLDCLLQVSEQGLLSSVTDCGGGGLSSAVGEMGKRTGVIVHLDRVPLKYEGLSPREIWISESQERMILSVPPERVEDVRRMFTRENVEATVIGEFTDDHRLRLQYHGDLVADLDMDFLHDGLPMPTRTARIRQPGQKPAELPDKPELERTLLGVVGSLNSCSREGIIREYDHEVQGGSVIKSLVGPHRIGPQDAVVIIPIPDRDRGVIVACGFNPNYGKRDAYRMALSAVDEALRNLTATGGDIGKAAMLDNSCFGSPDRPEVLGDIVQVCRACYAAARAFGVPFVSGKDSLNNEWVGADGVRHGIPATLLVSVFGIIERLDACVTMDLKHPDSRLFLIGTTREELGGSEYLRYLGGSGGEVPNVDLVRAPQIMRSIHEAMGQGLVRACHDLSEGGLAVALCEMAFGGDIGVDVDLAAVPFAGERRRTDVLLFSESNTRFLVEVAGERADEFQRFFAGGACAHIGNTTDQQLVRIREGSREILALPLERIRQAHQRSGMSAITV